MDDSVNRQEFDNAQQKRGAQIFDRSLRLMQRFLDWLIGLFTLTEEEQNDAGVYLGNLGAESRKNDSMFLRKNR